MQGFKCVNGDVVIENNEIQMVSGAELLRQTVTAVLNTNKGEWWLDTDEGITFSNILGKNAVKQVGKSTQTAVGDEFNKMLEQRLDGVT